MVKTKRNDPCPCGSGRKYKKCCLRNHEMQRDARIDIQRAQEEAAKRPKSNVDIRDADGNKLKEGEDYEHDEETGSLIIKPEGAGQIVTLDELDPEETEEMMQRAANQLHEAQKGVTLVRK